MSTVVVIASRYDEGAKRLATQWNAALLTPSDLSANGWRYRAAARENGSMVAGGRVLSNRDVGGVLTRLPIVTTQELEHVHAEDRPYVASEMSAFLLAWLSTLHCPVVNRPSPECLCGPGWRGAKWFQLAASLRIPVEPLRRNSTGIGSEGVPDDSVGVTVIGDRCFGHPEARLAANAQELAAAARVDLLEVLYTKVADEYRFSSVNLCPNLSDPELAGGVLDHLQKLAAC